MWVIATRGRRSTVSIIYIHVYRVGTAICRVIFVTSCLLVRRRLTRASGRRIFDRLARFRSLRIVDGELLQVDRQRGDDLLLLELLVYRVTGFLRRQVRGGVLDELLPRATLRGAAVFTVAADQAVGFLHVRFHLVKLWLYRDLSYAHLHEESRDLVRDRGVNHWVQEYNVSRRYYLLPR